MTLQVPDDGWREADAYEGFMGRWSRPLGSRFLSWLAIPPGAHWLEVGCGTGALTSSIRELSAPGSVTACDTAAPFVAYCAAEVKGPGITIVVGGPGGLPRRRPGYDAVVSSLVLNFLPEPAVALSEMREHCVPGGCVAATVWDYSDGMELLRIFWDEAIALDPTVRSLDEGERFPLCRPDALRALFEAAELEDVTVAALTVPTRFPSFDDYWRPFTRGVGPAPRYLASLSAARRHALEARLRSRLMRTDTVGIALSARAWAARGRRAVA